MLYYIYVEDIHEFRMSTTCYFLLSITWKTLFMEHELLAIIFLLLNLYDILFIYRFEYRV